MGEPFLAGKGKWYLVDKAASRSRSPFLEDNHLLSWKPVAGETLALLPPYHVCVCVCVCVCWQREGEGWVTTDTTADLLTRNGLRNAQKLTDTPTCTTFYRSTAHTDTIRSY